MENVKVIYFPLKAMAEGIRMMLAYNDQDFEDVRISQEDWPALKPNTPFGQLPILEINGKQYAQATPILRFLGKKYGLGGSNSEEDLEIDQNLEFYNDIRKEAGEVFHETDEKTKAEMNDNLQKTYYPTMLAKLNEMITQNNGHIALGKLTWADFMFAGMYDCLKLLLQIPDLDEKFPIFKKLQENVINLPKVREYCDNAPKCDV